MREFTIMAQMNTTDEMAWDVLADISQAISDILTERGVGSGGIAIVPDRTITDDEFNTDETFDDAMNERFHNGVNNNPMPDNMPSL